jgi:Arc/MetJ-type ribon-helix-helix transcriptional regulator
MATFRKRGDKWQARVQRKGQPDLSKSFLLKADAETWARQLESEIDRGLFQDRSEAERTTFGDLLDRYVKEITPLKKSATSEKQRILRFKREDNVCKETLLYDIGLQRGVADDALSPGEGVS